MYTYVLLYMHEHVHTYIQILHTVHLGRVTSLHVAVLVIWAYSALAFTGSNYCTLELKLYDCKQQ